MVEPSPGPLSLHFGKMNIDKPEELPMIEENDIDNISIMSESPEENENNIEEVYEKKPEESEVKPEESEVKPEESEVKPEEPLDIDSDEQLPGETSPDGTTEKEPDNENSLEYKDEIIVSGTVETEHISPISEPTEAPTPISPSDNFTEDCEKDDHEVVYFTDANPILLADNFLEMRKQGGVYFVPFKKPLVVQTPVFKLSESVTSGSVTLKITKGFATFVKEIEQTILNAAFVNKSSWFRTELTNEIITEGFKSFMNENDLKVKVSEELTSFDEEGNYIENNFKTPVGVRCILELTGICFGKLEFGSMFTLTQVQTTKIPKCVINASREKRTSGTNFSGDFV
ncbi:hypothetical protein PBCVMA1E_428L [Paramecium bursaria Chlorella virus MA1E]|nr:hypothetical protein PBCVMA1E_428L [Paramecium bursaria Chlorella virus MA1E]